MKTIIVVMVLLCSAVAFAGEIKRPDSYNYTRGVEAVNNNNDAEALGYLNKEIQEYPDNGYAYLWRAVVESRNGRLGDALTTLNVAVKKIPSNDKEYMASAYSMRASVFLSLQDTVQAYKDYAAAIDATPQEAKLYNYRAQVYYEQKKYDMADKDYRKIIRLEEGNVLGYMGIGRNANAQKRYEDAIKQFDYVIKLAPSYSSGYSFRAESYMGLKRYGEALDDVITALSIDNDINAFYKMQQLADSVPELTIAKLKLQRAKDPNNVNWLYCIGVAYDQSENYRQAIASYKEYLSKDPDARVAYYVAECYENLGLYDEALKYCNQAIEADSTDTDYIYTKATQEARIGRLREANDDMSAYISKEPAQYVGYYSRGWIKIKMKDYDGAIEDYTMSITLNPNYAGSYMWRGLAYKEKGEPEKAKNDFLESIRLDSVPELASCSYYAYYYLGEKDKAIGVIDAMLKNGREDCCYDVACVYSMMGDADKAIYYLDKALEKNLSLLCQLEYVQCFDGLKNKQAYKELVSKYKKRQQDLMEDEKQDDGGEYEEKVEEVPFSKDGGVLKVKCAINNLPLHFIFDTGASVVSISSVEATFMVKNDYLSANDVIGKQNYINANGEISEGTVINLRDVKLGENLHLKDVRASVVKNQSAPLLLGQSVLSRLGKIEIDNSRHVLRVTYKHKLPKSK